MKCFAAVLLGVLVCGAGSNQNTNGNTFGVPSAPVMIEVFSDFQCPSCKGLHDNMLPQIMKEYVVPGKVFMIYRYFPLPMHPYGRPAAEFAAAAARVGKYEPVADALFAQQAVWGASGKVEDTVDKVLTPTEARKVKSLLKDPAVQQEIEADITEGKAVPVTGTPTMWITSHGKSYSLVWPVSYPLLKSFLDSQLSH
jgi:protein-disulfide isomerase